MESALAAQTPTKRIVSLHSLNAFLDSPTHAALVTYLEDLNSSITGVKTTAASDTETVSTSSVTQGLLEILNLVEQVVNEVPPVENGNSRFGNPAFRDFYDRVAEKAILWHSTLIPGLEEEAPMHAMTKELAGYFVESWGNRTRVDYGSGMELNFICWLFCLHKLGLLKDEDNRAVVLKVFWKYMTITRLLQTTYWLEPAGSHGAQGLDDYHFAVFIFGSSQLRGHKHLRPKAIHDNDILDEFSKDYMYLDYVRYINSIKTASLRWHSPMLDDISGVKTWDKVNSGMLKMYKAEVLAKLPVAQHFLFGSLLPYPIDAIAEDEHLHEDGVHRDEDGHVHVRGQGFEDCCGIPIPSAFAAAKEAEEKRKGISPGVVGAGAGGASTKVRRIPFD